MYKTKKIILCFALCVLIFSLCACGDKSSDNAAIYGETIAGLEDNELFAIVDTNASSPVLLVTSQVYDDGLGNQAALNCEVYYLVNKEVKNIGTIESMGTAYPIAYDETGIYAASGHDMQRFEIEESGALKLAEGIFEQFDDSGNATYTMDKGDETKVITEEEYYAVFEKYNDATIVSFSYGASDTGNASVVTNKELEASQGSITEDINVPEIVQQIASEFGSKKTEAGQYSDWRIGLLELAYTYEDLNGKTFEVYQMDYECKSDNPPKVTLAGGMTMDENGWVRPEYANSTFLIFVRQGNELFYATTLVENDCAPGDDIFTNDLQIALEK